MTHPCLYVLIWEEKCSKKCPESVQTVFQKVFKKCPESVQKEECTKRDSVHYYSVPEFVHILKKQMKCM